METTDYLVVGAGIVGLTLARALAARGAGSITILEKEPRVGLHASGRNSGVLHSGIYYPADTLKARVCARGATLMRAFAEERGIPLIRTGKVIVATDSHEAGQLDVLFQRGRSNGIAVERLDAQELHALEPEVVAAGGALHSPDTSVIDSHAVLAALESELATAGARLIKGSQLTRVDVSQRRAHCTHGTVAYGTLVNAAGLHADRVAHFMGVGRRYHMLPFKGLYRYLRPEAAQRFRGSIYPVPDLRMPFLGVHVTRGVNGSVTLGPTAIPALGRENYDLLGGIQLGVALRMAAVLGRMVAGNRQGLRQLVRRELRHYSAAGVLAAARKLAPRLGMQDLTDKTKVGLRAQLVDSETLTLVMDFVLEDGPSSVHVLNAISPAFTSSFALADLVADRVLGVPAR